VQVQRYFREERGWRKRRKTSSSRKPKDDATNTLKSTIRAHTGSEAGARIRKEPRAEISYQDGILRNHIVATQQKIYVNGMTLEYKQSVVMESQRQKQKITKKYTVDTLRDGCGRRERSVFGLCSFSLLLLLVPVSGSHLEPEEEEGEERSISTSRVRRQQGSPLDMIKVRKLLLEFLQLALHKSVIRVRLLRSTSTPRLF